MTPLEKAQKKLADFLEQHPDKIASQKEIERLLDASGTMDNRLLTLQTLIQAEQFKLVAAIKRLQGIVKSVDK